MWSRTSSVASYQPLVFRHRLMSISLACKCHFALLFRSTTSCLALFQTLTALQQGEVVGLVLQHWMGDAANTFSSGNQLCSWQSSVCSWHFCVNHLLQPKVDSLPPQRSPERLTALCVELRQRLCRQVLRARLLPLCVGIS